MDHDYKPKLFPGETEEQAWYRIHTAAEVFYRDAKKRVLKYAEIDAFHHQINETIHRERDPQEEADWISSLTPVSEQDIDQITAENYAAQQAESLPPMEDDNQPFDLDILRRSRRPESRSAYQRSVRRMHFPCKTFEEAHQSLVFKSLSECMEYRVLQVRPSERNATGFYAANQRPFLTSAQRKRPFVHMTDSEMPLIVRFARHFCATFAAIGIPMYPRFYMGDKVDFAHMYHHEAMQGRMIDVILQHALQTAIELRCMVAFEPPLSFIVDPFPEGKEDECIDTLHRQRRAIMADQNPWAEQ